MSLMTRSDIEAVYVEEDAKHTDCFLIDKDDWRRVREQAMLACRTEELPKLPEAPEHLKRLADRVHQGDGMTLKERTMAAAVILSFATPHELRDLGHQMLASSNEYLRWHAEQIAAKLGCSGPYTCGSGLQPPPANDGAGGPHSP